MQIEQIIKILSDTSLSATEKARILGIGIATVQRWKKRYGVTARKKYVRNTPSTKKPINCKTCGKEFLVSPSDIVAGRKFCSRVCKDTNPEWRQFLKNVDRTYSRPGLRKDDTPEFTRFKNKVHRLTQKTYLANIKILNPLGLVRGLAGTNDVYHLDHIISVRKGYDIGMTAEDLSKLENLRMLPWKENISRNKKEK